MEHLKVLNQNDIQPITMTVKEAAKCLNINSNAMYALAHRADFTAALKIGRRILISRKALEEWIKREAEKPIID